MKKKKYTLGEASKDISEITNIPYNEIYGILRIYFDLVANRLMQNEDVAITGVGKFKIGKKPNSQRWLYNLSTKQVEFRNVPVITPNFEFTKTFIKKIRENYKDIGE